MSNLRRHKTGGVSGGRLAWALNYYTTDLIYFACQSIKLFKEVLLNVVIHLYHGLKDKVCPTACSQNVNPVVYTVGLIQETSRYMVMVTTRKVQDGEEDTTTGAAPGIKSIWNFTCRLVVEDRHSSGQYLPENLERLVRPQVASPPTYLQSPL
ncbi:hypothetical protein Tco_0421559 [Tanacetum coccineum]